MWGWENGQDLKERHEVDFSVGKRTAQQKGRGPCKGIQAQRAETYDPGTVSRMLYTGLKKKETLFFVLSATASSQQSGSRFLAAF